MNESQPPIHTLRPCQVPWMVSPSMSSLTLVHAESDVEHKCSVVFGGGRLTATGQIDTRRIEVAFHGCERSGLALLPDDAGVEHRGYELRSEGRSVAMADYPQWLISRWQASGSCPDSGLWVSTSSPAHALSNRSKLYVLAGRNGYAEIVAAGFSWREWIWTRGHRDALADAPPVLTGASVE